MLLICSRWGWRNWPRSTLPDINCAVPPAVTNFTSEIPDKSKDGSQIRIDKVEEPRRDSPRHRLRLSLPERWPFCPKVVPSVRPLHKQMCVRLRTTWSIHSLSTEGMLKLCIATPITYSSARLQFGDALLRVGKEGLLLWLVVPRRSKGRVDPGLVHGSRGICGQIAIDHLAGRVGDFPVADEFPASIRG